MTSSEASRDDEAESGSEIDVSFVVIVVVG